MRRKTNISERLKPCEACGYPISQRHHMLDFATHGENDETSQLCACCHEIFHLLVHTRDGEHESASQSRALIECLKREMPDRVKAVQKIRFDFGMKQILSFSQSKQTKAGTVHHE